MSINWIVQFTVIYHHVMGCDGYFEITQGIQQEFSSIYFNVNRKALQIFTWFALTKCFVLFLHLSTITRQINFGLSSTKRIQNVAIVDFLIPFPVPWWTWPWHLHVWNLLNDLFVGWYMQCMCVYIYYVIYMYIHMFLYIIYVYMHV